MDLFQFGVNTFGPQIVPTVPSRDVINKDQPDEFRKGFLTFKHNFKVKDLIDNRNLFLLDTNMNICQPAVNYHNLQENHEIYKHLLNYCVEPTGSDFGSKTWKIYLVMYIASKDSSALSASPDWDPVRCVLDNQILCTDGSQYFGICCI